MPRLAGYFVVARRQPMRAISIVLARIGGPDRVFATLDDALVACREEPIRR